MKDTSFLELLEQAVERLSIKLSYEDLRKGEVDTRGGICVVRGEKRILIHKALGVQDKVDVLLELLSGLDTEGVHLPPEVRERLESVRKAG